MGIYQGFRTTNSKKVTTYRDTNLVGDTFKILSTLQERQDKAVAKRDEIEAALEDATVADQDREAWNGFKQVTKKKLETIPESAYIGDLDRQINKIAHTTLKGLKEVENNYLRRQQYVEEGKKLGLDEQRLAQHVALSNQQGGLKYDPNEGFGNRFNGVAYTKAPSEESIRKALELTKPVKRRVIQGDKTIETEVYDPSDPNNLAIYKHYFDSSPELQKEVAFQNAYSKLQSSKLDYHNLDKDGKKAIVQAMVKYNTDSPREAYKKYLENKNEQDVFGLVTSNALLKYQKDYKEDLSDAGKQRLNFGYDIAKMKIANQFDLQKIDYTQDRLDARERLQAELKAKQEQGFNIDTQTPGISPYSFTDENGKIEERSIGSKLLEGAKNAILNQFRDNKEDNKIGDYDFGQVGYNYLRTHSKEFEAIHRMLVSGKDQSGKKLNKDQVEKLQEFQQKQVTEHEKEIKKAVEGQTLQHIPMTIKLGKKIDDEQQSNLVQLFGANFSGGAGSHFRAKEITQGKVSAPQELKTFTDDLDIEDWNKELRKAVKDNGGNVITLDGITGSDGDFTRSLAITFNDPNDSKKNRKFLVEIPNQSPRIQTKKGVADINKMIQAKNYFVSEGAYETKDGKTHEVEYRHVKDKGNSIIHIVDKKTGDELEAIRLDSNNRPTN